VEGERMIYTGLPYDMSALDKIREGETVVDMSDIKFPNVEAEQQKKVSFIFLRNTSFDVKLDFSKCSFEDKEAFLLLYLTEDIDVKYKEFAFSYIKILNSFINNDFDMECILTEQEIQQFIKNNHEFVLKIFKLIKSLPVYAMFYFVLNNQAYTLEDFKKTDDETIKTNFVHLITSDGFMLLFDCDVEETPMFYTKLFTVDNEELLAAIKQLPFFEILYGLANVSGDKWNSVMSDANALLENLQKDGDE
jgi:hypothetical protein